MRMRGSCILLAVYLVKLGFMDGKDEFRFGRIPRKDACILHAKGCNSTLVGAQHNHWTFVVEHAMTITGSIRLDYHLIRSTAFSIGSSAGAGIQEAFDLGQ